MMIVVCCFRCVRRLARGERSGLSVTVRTCKEKPKRREKKGVERKNHKLHQKRAESKSHFPKRQPETRIERHGKKKRPNQCGGDRGEERREEDREGGGRAVVSKQSYWSIKPIEPSPLTQEEIDKASLLVDDAMVYIFNEYDDDKDGFIARREFFAVRGTSPQKHTPLSKSTRACDATD